VGDHDYVVRRAGPADGEAVARELAAYLEFLGEAPDLTGLDHDVARWQEVYAEPRGALLLVIAPDGREVGTAAVRVLEPGVAEIKRMWLRPAHRGRGLGRRLMDACLAETRRLGCRVVRLDSEARLETAIRLYRAYGFTEIADYNGNPLAQVWMERREAP
jgi:ribosomal protein S18 acetylase RimI-like enzyme